MKRIFHILGFGLVIFAACFVLSPITSTQAAGSPEDYKGTWKAELDDDPGEIHITFERKWRNGNQMHGSDYKISDFEGLTASQVNSDNAQVNFRLVREAGSLDCEGIFRRGKGIGDWKLNSNPKFVSGMKSRGYDLSDSQLFNAVTLDLTVSLADDLKAAGFNDLDFEDLVKARIFKIDSTYAKEMKALGFGDLGMEELVKGRIFKIDADYARQVREMGFPNAEMEELVRLRIFKITPEYLKGFKAAKLAVPSIEEAVRLSIFKVTPEFIKEVNDAGLKNLQVEELVRLKIFKIDGNFIRRVKEQTKEPISVEDLVQLKIHGGRSVRFKNGQNIY